MLGASPFISDDFVKLTNLINDLKVTLKNSSFTAYNVKKVFVLNGGDYKVEFISNSQKIFPLNLTVGINNSIQSTISYLKSVFSSPEFKASLLLSSKPLKNLDLRFNQKVFYEFWE